MGKNAFWNSDMHKEHRRVMCQEITIPGQILVGEYNGIC